MLIHPQIDPVAIAIGPLAVRWYGLMYLVGFGTAFWLARRRIKQDRGGSISYAVFDDPFFFSVLGVVLGGRLGWLVGVLAPGLSRRALRNIGRALPDARALVAGRAAG